MSRTLEPAAVRRALAQRLRAVAAVLLDPPLPAVAAEPADDAAVLLDLLVRRVHAEPTADRVWLLYIAISSSLPTPDAVRAVMRQFELSDVLSVTLWMLDTGLEASRSASAVRELVVTGKVVADVDHSAQHDLHTGIQQVVRQTIPYWAVEHDLELVAWTPGGTAHRALTDAEHARITRWGEQDAPVNQATDLAPLIVPWRTTLILTEVPPGPACQRLAALGQFSGNRVSAIGYDCIPIVSAPMVPAEEPNNFSLYLSAVKYAHRVAAISVSANTEFSGFADALATQGLRGPIVTECILPFDAAPEETEPPPEPGPPVVLAVGSFEPRKNHLALLFAAEILWREGLEFRLRLIGGSGWGTDVPDRVRNLQAEGYPVGIESRVPDAELRLALRGARFTVFASLHEGYGLPVAESIAAGTPVVTSNYGSPTEIGAGRGALFVDPRNDDDIVDAMRTLLVDDVRLAELQAQTALRPNRTWKDYAADAWRILVDEANPGELA